MSSLLANAKGAEVSITPQRTLIVNHPLNNVQQWTKGVAANPKTIEPNGTTVIDVKFNSDKWEQEINHFFTYSVKNTGTPSITFKNGALNHFNKIKITPNSSDVAIEIDSLFAVKSIIANFYLKTYGLDIFEGTSFIRNEHNTFNGITVAGGSSVKFFYDLAPFIDFAKTTIKGQIFTLRFELEATPAPSTIKGQGEICVSSTTDFAYTDSTIQFENINYVRQYAIVQNPNLLVGFLSTDRSVRKVHYKVYQYKMYSGSWKKSLGDTVSFKLSDLRKTDNIQYIEPVAVPIVTATNSAECCKEYSGHHWMGYKWRQLNTSDENELDLTDQRILKEHEIQQYHNQYGKFKQLPSELFTDANHAFTKYYLPMTKINFDYLPEISDHEVIRRTSSIREDYDIQLFPNGELDNVDINVRVIVAEVLEYDKKSGQLRKV
jgi:hypothetical protein